MCCLTNRGSALFLLASMEKASKARMTRGEGWGSTQEESPFWSVFKTIIPVSLPSEWAARFMLPNTNHPTIQIHALHNASVVPVLQSESAMLTCCPMSVKGIPEEKLQKLSEVKSHILLTCNNSTFLVHGIKAVYLSIKSLYFKQGKQCSRWQHTYVFINHRSISGQVQRTSADKTQFPYAAQKLKEEREQVLTMQGSYLVSFCQKYKEIQTIMYYSAMADSSNTIQSCNYTNTIYYIAKVNFHSSKIEKRKKRF